MLFFCNGCFPILVDTFWSCLQRIFVILLIINERRQLTYAFNNSAHIESRLIAKLFDTGYDTRARPVLDPSKSVEVSFRIDLSKVIDINERTQIVSILTVTYQTWRDPRLAWHSADYNGLDALSIFYDRIWTPDTALYNSVDMYRDNVEDRQNAVIWSDDKDEGGALIQLMYNSRHTVGCHFDMAKFPFDTQTCEFTYGSWTLDAGKINYSLPEGQAATIEHYEPHIEWSLVSFRIDLERMQYQCCANPYVTMVVKLQIRRRPLFHIVNLIMPAVVINLIASFALFASAGDANNRHDKLNIGITTLLSYCVMLLSVANEMPKSSTSVPLLNCFYFCFMLQDMLKICVSVVLSYEVQRQKFLNILVKVSLIFKKRRRVSSENVAKVGLEEAETWARNHRSPEHFCFFVNISITLFITALMFGIGYGT